MIVLGLDPGLKATGYAVVEIPLRFVPLEEAVHRGWRASHALTIVGMTLIVAGRISPSPSKGSTHTRVRSVVHQVLELYDEHEPDVTVVELPSSHVNPHRHGGGGAGLAIYGWTAGAIWASLPVSCRSKVVEVYGDEWTRGAWQRQKDRRAIAKAHFPAYEPDQDLGGDAADACCLVVWAAKWGRLA